MNSLIHSDTISNELQALYEFYIATMLLQASHNCNQQFHQQQALNRIYANNLCKYQFFFLIKLISIR